MRGGSRHGLMPVCDRRPVREDKITDFFCTGGRISVFFVVNGENFQAAQCAYVCCLVKERKFVNKWRRLFFVVKL